jgi:hypothetical protein
MFKQIGRKIYIVYALNSIIAFAYFINNLDANYSELSSDIQNIIPVAQKFDDPSLFKRDLYLDTIDNVRYYTPFYVQSLRGIATFTAKNYIQAINVLGLFCHLLFGVLWFFLLYKFTNNFWLSLLVSIFLRGIVWLPGLEIWGISGLWSIMPRTVYITLMPIPFLVLTTKYTRVLLASFFIGLIFNFHPITGLGGVLLFCALLVIYVVVNKDKKAFNFKRLLSALGLLILGMLPFILTYFGKTSSEVNYSINDYDIAFNRRIPAYFSDPIYFIKEWFKVRNLFYFLPVLLFLYVSKGNHAAFKKAKILFWLSFVSVVIPILSIPVENVVNEWFNLNLRLSFQLVRVQKVAIIPGVFALVYLGDMLLKKHKRINNLLPYAFCLYLFLLIGSHSKYFKQIPFIGDDISRSILPSNLSLFSNKTSKKIAADRMADYIKENTDKDVLLCASSGFYRGSAMRSVTLDTKGASMIIEGNPAKFIEWSKQQNKAMSMTSMEDIIDYFRTLGIDYFITRGTLTNATLIHKEGLINLYKL